MVKSVGEPTVWLSKLHANPEALKAEHPELYANVYSSSPPGAVKVNTVALELLRSHTRMRREKGSASVEVKKGGSARAQGSVAIDNGQLLDLVLQTLRRQTDSSDGINFQMLGAGGHKKIKINMWVYVFEYHLSLIHI